MQMSFQWMKVPSQLLGGSLLYFVGCFHLVKYCVYEGHSFYTRFVIINSIIRFLTLEYH